MVHITTESDHEKAFNLARRFTAQNDPDMMHACYEETLAGHIAGPRKIDHAGAMNLARRLTAQNDPDVMHSCIEESTPDYVAAPMSPRKYNHDSCSELASHLISAGRLPVECRSYTDVVSNLKRRESDRTDGTALLT